jgi:hypothetical protein
MPDSSPPRGSNERPPAPPLHARRVHSLPAPRVRPAPDCARRARPSARLVARRICLGHPFARPLRPRGSPPRIRPARRPAHLLRASVWTSPASGRVRPARPPGSSPGAPASGIRLDVPCVRPARRPAHLPRASVCVSPASARVAAARPPGSSPSAPASGIRLRVPWRPRGSPPRVRPARRPAHLPRASVCASPASGRVRPAPGPTGAASGPLREADKIV